MLILQQSSGLLFFHTAGGRGAARSEEIPLKQHWDGSSAGDQDGGVRAEQRLAGVMGRHLD